MAGVAQFGNVDGIDGVRDDWNVLHFDWAEMKLGAPGSSTASTIVVMRLDMMFYWFDPIEPQALALLESCVNIKFRRAGVGPDGRRRCMKFFLQVTKN
jgi:hypothetical protein